MLNSCAKSLFIAVYASCIYHVFVQHISPLPSLLMKRRLSHGDVLECRKVIFHVVSLESRNEPLPSLLTGGKSKAKR